MPEDFREYVDPIRPKAAIDRLEHERGGPPVPRAHGSVHGLVMGVRRGQSHQDGPHRLDVTVGGDETTEVVIRVPKGSCANWDGKKVVLYLEE